MNEIIKDFIDDLRDVLDDNIILGGFLSLACLFLAPIVIPLFFILAVVGKSAIFIIDILNEDDDKS